VVSLSNRMVSEGNKRGTYHKSADKKKSTPRSDREEIATFRHICRMNDSWKIKWLVVSIKHGMNRTTRQRVGWWYRRLVPLRAESLCSRQIEVETNSGRGVRLNGRWAQGLWWWWWTELTRLLCLGQTLQISFVSKMVTANTFKHCSMHTAWLLVNVVNVRRL